LIVKEFIELNHRKLILNDELKHAIKQHQEASNILLAHYDIERRLDKPIVEYARYVLSKGSDSERAGLTGGIQNKLILKDQRLRLHTTSSREIKTQRTPLG